MTVHELKTVPPYFDRIAAGQKTFDVRANDRGYQVGDEVLFQEWHSPPTTLPERWHCRVCVCMAAPGGHYADREPLRFRIEYVHTSNPLFGGIEPGYAVLGLTRWKPPLGDTARAEALYRVLGLTRLGVTQSTLDAEATTRAVLVQQVQEDLLAIGVTREELDAAGFPR